MRCITLCVMLCCVHVPYVVSVFRCYVMCCGMMVRCFEFRFVVSYHVVMCVCVLYVVIRCVVLRCGVRCCVVLCCDIL